MRFRWMWYGLSLAAAGLFLISPAPSDDQPAHDAARKAQVEADAGSKARYDDPQAFAQMSGAKQSALERKFGVRPVRGVAFTGEEMDEPMDEVLLEDVPAFAREAIDQAVSEAPESVLTKPIVWEKAFQIAETIAMYQLKGHDAKGRPVEVESKGTRVIEMEVHVPASEVPAAIRKGAKALAATFDARDCTAVIVGGKVISYTLVGTDAENADVAVKGRLEATFTPAGKLIGRRKLDE